jgi:carboxyl-terminal processing protease
VQPCQFLQAVQYVQKAIMANYDAEDVFQTFIDSFTEVIDPHTSLHDSSTAAQFNIDMN